MKVLSSRDGCYIVSVFHLPRRRLSVELSEFNRCHTDTASFPPLNGCLWIYRLGLSHLPPHRYSCKTDTIDPPLLGDVKGSSIACVTSKLKECPDADHDDTKCLSCIVISLKTKLRNVLFIYPLHYRNIKINMSSAPQLFVLLPHL